jgi:hypothetical protein
MSKTSKVQLYTTSTATTLKLKHDVKRMKELLDAKKVNYEEVGLEITASPTNSASIRQVAGESPTLVPAGGPCRAARQEIRDDIEQRRSTPCHPATAAR